jgi:hypothetical protein
MEGALPVARALHFAATLVLQGSLAFQFWVLRPVFGQGGRSNRPVAGSTASPLFWRSFPALSGSDCWVQTSPARRSRRVPTGSCSLARCLAEVIQVHWRKVLIAIGSRIGSNIVFYVFSVFLLVYLRLKLGLDTSSLGFAALLCASLAQLLGIPLFGTLSDTFGCRPILMFGGISCIVWALIFLPLVNTKSTSLIFTATFVGIFLHGAMWGPLSSYMPEMFPTRVRYTGASLGFQGASVFGGALAPIIATWLLGEYQAATINGFLTIVMAGMRRGGSDCGRKRILSPPSMI